MPPWRTALLTSAAMLAFAGNSLLCRLALDRTSIDAATFTTVRLVSGAAILWLVASRRPTSARGRGTWPSAIALFAYAAGFSFAYLELSTGTGALLLFGAVQATMIGVGLWRGERLSIVQSAGLVLALGGLVGLLLPGLSAPPLVGSLWMLVAGVAWGVYSLRGQGAGDPTRVTAGNFLRAAPIALVVTLALWTTLWSRASPDPTGLLYAAISGAITSGLGYAVWYTALPGLRATSAATVQLSVPPLAALAGVVVLGEALTPRLVLASSAILGGIALVVGRRRTR